MPTPIGQMRKNIDQIFDQVNQQTTLVNEEIRGLFGSSYAVDEIALYFPFDEALFAFTAYAVQRGWQVFNYAEDEVQTAPIASTYSVIYWFLQHPSHSYRLELMRVVDGFSPLHGSMAHLCDVYEIAVILAHASFKVPDETTFAAHGVALRNAGFEVAQHCESNYGRFSYYKHHDRNELAFVKPRMNTRDAQ